MQKTLLFALGIMVASSLSEWNYALAQMDNTQALRTTDETGCYLTDGSFTGPTIVLAAGLYHEPNFPKGRAMEIIDTALSAGCSINEPDEAGSTPLIAAILYNEPKLTKMLLSNRANPYLKITSPKKYLNGLDAFQIFEFLIKNQPSKNREALGQLLEQYRREA